MRIEIPMLPPHALSPNARPHWTEKARATKLLRETAFYCAYQERQKWLQGHEKAELSITFIIRDRRGYKDPDNALACLKPALDGCVDAGVIPDDSDEHLRIKLPIMYEIDRARAPLTILEFREILK